MAVLSDENRAEVWADFMRELSASRSAVGITKTDLRAAVDAVDAWLDSNATSMNSAIPQPARGSLTTKQKAWLLIFVTQRRYLVA